MKRKVCILTSLHSPFDGRIFHKEGRTLAKEGYDVTLIAQHNKEDIENGIRIIPLPKPKNRFERMTKTSWLLFRLALKQKADVYHFHDPELILVGVLLKLFTRGKVIYDVHEDYEQKILSKYWIPKGLRKPISFLMGIFEKISSRFFDYIITADSHTKTKFENNKTEVIANFPLLNFADGLTAEKGGNTFKVIYVGGICKDRGIFKMLEAMEYLRDVEIELHLLGVADNQNLINLLNSKKTVKYHGVLPWQKVAGYLINADVGLLLLQPVPAYLYYPGENVIKLFEYMIMGLPVIISEFPKLKNLVSELGCGVSVDPTDPMKIAETIEYLYHNQDLRKVMGENGRSAVLEKYNWETESEKLLQVYKNTTNAK
jgi:glycosyltransferase involved in cell wall biosynthesis